MFGYAPRSRHSGSLACACLLILGSICGGSSRNAHPADPSRSSQTQFTARLAETEHCTECPSRKKFTIAITDGSGAQKAVRIVNEMSVFERIAAVTDERTVVIGEAQGGLKVVTILDNRQGAVADYFLCFAPSVSPDKRFIAYVKMFPLHFTPGVSAEYLVYDLQRSARENRGTSVGLADHTDVGRPIYPQNMGNTPADNIGLPDSEQHQLAADGFTWFPGDLLRFADRSDDTVAIITADLSATTTRIPVKMQPLPVTSIVNPKSCPDFANRPAFAFHVSALTIDPETPKSITVHLSTLEPGCLTSDHVKVEDQRSGSG